MTTVPCCLVVWNSAVSLPSWRQTDTVSGSPGSTGRLNRPAMEPNLAGSELLCSAEPKALTGRITYSQGLLAELRQGDGTAPTRR